MNSDNKFKKDEKFIKSVLNDFYESRSAKNADSDHLEAAMFIEDSFSIVLEDDEISPEILSNPEDCLKLVIKKHQQESQ
ncbi:MAG: hypothetical protein JXR70_13910 [Spirochaetales bacterium]|nr:hypothetical protein [Spirochaetales bacterium]